jgi:hypothetical protein
MLLPSSYHSQAGDTAYQWAANMMNDSTCEVLEKLGADKEYLGRVIVPEHIPKARPISRRSPHDRVGDVHVDP